MDEQKSQRMENQVWPKLAAKVGHQHYKHTKYKTCSYKKKKKIY